MKVEDETEEKLVRMITAELDEERESNGLSLPKPMEGLYENGPPPFLTKTYEMVENPKTDEILSWGENGVSFIVWDPHKFSIDLLPKYFKHNNFSTFVRQLNAYGFRKVHVDRWEFANLGFQKGKKHLLKTVKRRNHGANNQTRLLLEKETELDILKKEQEKLRLEIDDLKQQQFNSDKHLSVIEERVRHAEWKQRQLLMFIAKAMKNMSFQQLVQSCQQKKALGGGEVSKKRRLTSSENGEDSFVANGMISDNMCCKQEEQDDDTPGIQSEMNLFLSPDSSVDPVNSNSTAEDYRSVLSSGLSCSPDLSTSNFIMWEKLMEDDVICKDEEVDALPADQSDNYFMSWRT